MKKVTLKSLTLVNFKGEKKRTTKFNSSITTIAGMNGLGKTRHFDAFIWLLFGKDSQDRKDYEIKTRIDGSELHKVECSVTGILDVDGQELTLKRAIIEDWVKPRGQAEQIYKGNHTECWWNETPVNVSEYENRVNGIITATVFKMITNPAYFANMPWKLQRCQLFELAGTATDEEIVLERPEFKALFDKLSGKSMADFKAELSARKKRLKAELDEIQPRIDQTVKMKPKTEDWEALTSQIAQIDNAIATIDESLKDVTAAMRQASNATLDKQRQIDSLKVKCQNIDFNTKAKAREDAFKANAARREINQKLRMYEQELATTTKELSHLQEYQVRLQSEVAKLKRDQEIMREQWVEANASQWDGEPICPTCGQPMTEEMVAKKRATFAEDQKQICANIAERGLALGKEIKDLTTSINDHQQEIDRLTFRAESLQQEIDSLKNDLSTMPEAITPEEVNVATIPEYVELQIRIKALEAEVAKAKPTADTAGLDSQRKALEAQRQDLTVRLAQREAIAKADSEIAALEERGRELAAQIADAEKEEYTMQQFTQYKVEECEKRINAMFNSVRFRLFDYTIDGNPVETCIPLIDGVPYGSANTAAQINAGLDIINTLCRFYGICAPIFCDHAESVNTFITTLGQIIFLRVTDDNKLTIQ